jgi:hypothetical protein
MMSAQYLKITELAAWGFDCPVDRGLHGERSLLNAANHAQILVKTRSPYPTESPLSGDETSRLADALAARKNAIALSGEFDGLEWELGIVDLRKLIAFQRRVGFKYPDHSSIHQGLSALQLFDLSLPLNSPSKSPYMEVASYRGRWFLRDGYHRSFRLLNQSVYLVPCVVVYAESFFQMGAVGSRFFSQDVLFSEHPPMVTDFLHEEMTVRYRRAIPTQMVSSIVPQLQQTFAVGCHLQEVL